MTMRFLPTLLLGAALALGGPVLAKTDRAAAGEAKLSKALEGRVAGEPVRCINLRDIRSSKIYDRTAIVYDVGGKLYVNRPTGGAGSLDSDDIMVTRTTLSQLCDMDIVQLVDRGANFPRGFVNLGKFIPYSKPAKAS